MRGANALEEAHANQRSFVETGLDGHTRRRVAPQAASVRRQL